MPANRSGPAITFDTVRKIGLSLPGVEESTTYGVSSLKVGGKMFACPAMNSSAEPGTLAVRLDIARRDEMIAADPDTYYVTDHYVNYPTILVRLSRVRPDALRDLITMGWRFVSEKARRKPARPRKARKARR